MDIEQERKEFEKWAFQASRGWASFERDSYDKYWPDKLNLAWGAWQAAKSQVVPEGFVLVPVKDLKYFSNDGENYEVHDSLDEAKREAKCAIEHYEEMLADQQLDPACDGNFGQIGYGIILAESGYSIDHIVTQDDVDNGDYSYEVGTQIMSLHLNEVEIEAQEQSHD